VHSLSSLCVATDPTTAGHATVASLRTGMAASDFEHNDEPPAAQRPIDDRPALLPADAIGERLAEEVNRAARHGTALSCLLVTIGNLRELAREHGEDLSEQALAYIGRALAPQIRNFDRVGRPSEEELLVMLPGADGPRGEIVARRALERLRTIKVEADGERRALDISIGLATWREQESAQELLARARAAARPVNGAGDPSGVSGASPPALGRPGTA
jgi:diguanylate cyclase (GGDEF)-like protein